MKLREHTKRGITLDAEEDVRIVGTDLIPLRSMYRRERIKMFKTMIITYRNKKYEVRTYPDNDGRHWYYHPVTGKVVIVE